MANLGSDSRDFSREESKSRVGEIKEGCEKEREEGIEKEREEGCEKEREEGIEKEGRREGEREELERRKCPNSLSLI